jgi:hypothetical protein
MSFDPERVLRGEARRLATDMLRDPTLVIGYRDVVFDSYQDSQAEEKFRLWMRDAGKYSTRHDLLREALAEAPKTNLAAWDGAYLVRVGKSTLVCLQIDAAGVNVSKAPVDGETFTDGMLRFEPSRWCEWGAELRFSSVEPEGESIANGGVFQRQCTGRMWKKGTARPTEENAVGATMRHTLAASPPDPDLDDAANAVTPRRFTAMAPGALGATTAAATMPAFVDKWKGDYKVTLIGTKTDPVTGVLVDDFSAGPDYGVAGTDDKAVLTYTQPQIVDLTQASNRPSPDNISYTSGDRQFNLTFATFTQGTQMFSGTICPVDTTPPTAPNVTGNTDPPSAPPEWGSAVIAGTIITGLTLLAMVGTYLAKHICPKFGDCLNGQHAVDQGEPNAGRILDDRRMQLDLYRPGAASNADGVKMTSHNRVVAQEGAKKRAEDLQTQRQNIKADTNEILQVIDISIASEEQAKHDKTEAQSKAAELIAEGKNELAAAEQAKADAAAAREKEAKDNREENERKRDAEKKRDEHATDQAGRTQEFVERISVR